MKIVNIIASGDLHTELDLSSIYVDISVEHAVYEPEQFPGLQIKFTEESPVVTLFSSGSYTIVGAKTHDQVRDQFDSLIELLQDLNIDCDSETSQPEIKNLVCKDGLNREIDLDELVVVLGFENTEYEPEQSPFLYYWPEEKDCLITIPTNGQCIITGVLAIEEAQEAFSPLKKQIEELFAK